MSHIVLSFSDDDYTVTVRHNVVSDNLHHLVFHKELKGNEVVDRKFDLFLDDSQIKALSKFLSIVSYT